jgi:hypothetical protein
MRGASVILLGLCLTAPLPRSLMAAPSADEFGCPPEAAAYGGLAFTDAAQQHWYRRFWTGVCAGLPLLSCFSGRPFWGDTMAKILVKVPADHRSIVQHELCSLGRRVGFEWAKENDIRTIDTKMVIAWTKRLEAAADPEPAIEAVRLEAEGRLASAPGR